MRSAFANPCRYAFIFIKRGTCLTVLPRIQRKLIHYSVPSDEITCRSYQTEESGEEDKVSLTGHGHIILYKVNQLNNSHGISLHYTQ